jgi:hypothetical protein
MSLTRRILTVLSVACAMPSWAQEAPESPRPTSSSDRLFLAFAEDATVIDRQWWEGQLEIRDGEIIEGNYLRGIVAVQPWRDVELGGRFGFGSTDTASGLPDGSGGTDLDLWGKYYLGSDSNKTEFAVGGLLTIPTGDDAAGLGDDAFCLGGFGALRYRLPKWIFTAHGGLRVNGDGRTLELPEQDGKASLFLGAGGIVPFSDQVTFVGEVRYEGARFDGEFEIPGYDDDFRALGGLNWSGIGRGQIRGAVAVGFSDGAPDAQLLAGYAVIF